MNEKIMRLDDINHRRAARTDRRRFLGAAAAAGVAGLALPAYRLVGEVVGGETAAPKAKPRRRPRLKSRTVFLASPEPGASVWANTYYTRAKGLDKTCVMSLSRKSDVRDDWRRRFSSDNGKTWSDWEPIERFKVETPQGVHRQYPQPGWVDPSNGRMLVMVIDGVLPNDKPLEGMTHWSLRYRVSDDGGRTFVADEPVIQKGDFSADHPVEGVWIGRNSIMIGATTCTPIRTRSGQILVPVQIAPIGPDGRYWRPGGGYTYHDAAVLIGKWTDGKKIEWDLSQRVVNDPGKSTRGLIEPALAEMPDGRILMVCRGSNDVRPQLPGYKWYSISEDGGRNWSKPPRPWTYTDGSRFFSPSSCSQLLRHGNGKIYWIGNVSPDNPRGNSPRYPLVIGEVDPESLLLIKETVAVIDTKGPKDNESLQLSNFMAAEDRLSGEIVLQMTRFMPKPRPWRGDAYIYRIGP